MIRWFAQHSDRVLLLFDAHKTDIGDEFRQVAQLLRTPHPVQLVQLLRMRASPDPVALALALTQHRWCSPSPHPAQVVQLLREHAGKVRVVLNKADSVPPKGLLHVYGAMMWSLGATHPHPSP